MHDYDSGSYSVGPTENMNVEATCSPRYAANNVDKCANVNVQIMYKLRMPLCPPKMSPEPFFLFFFNNLVKNRKTVSLDERSLSVMAEASNDV